jgi:hypothetical protein
MAELTEGAVRDKVWANSREDPHRSSRSDRAMSFEDESAGCAYRFAGMKGRKQEAHQSWRTARAAACIALALATPSCTAMKTARGTRVISAPELCVSSKRKWGEDSTNMHWDNLS